RLFPGPHVDEGPADDGLLGLGERAVSDRELPVPVLDAGGPGIKRPGRDERAVLERLLDVGTHLGHHLGAGWRGRAGLIRRREHEVAHLTISFRPVGERSVVWSRDVGVLARLCSGLPRGDFGALAIYLILQLVSEPGRILVRLGDRANL